jgi:hypothetical protein
VHSGDSIENNKQHAVGIELISKKKKAHCVHGCSIEINIVMNGLWMKQITMKAKKKEMSGQKGFTFN